MLSEHNNTVSATESEAVKKCGEPATNACDNIIATNAPSECSSTAADEHTIKVHTADHHPHTITGKTVQFIQSQQRTATTTQQNRPRRHTSSRTAETDVSGARQPPLNFCNASQCVFFQDNIADVHHRKGRRLNGLQLPLHPLQIFGWLVLILFGVASFCVLIPAFAAEVQGPLYGLISGLYIVHVASHVAALLIDPADRELRRVHRNDRIVPEFDRSKHTHVIENGRCHLCNIRTTSARTKHCSVCNKCVGKFDHHCKWLNHCVGSRNYVAFLMCVVSAVIATLVIVAAVIAQIVLYCLQPEWLSYWQATGVIAPTTEVDAGTTENIAFVVSGNISSSNDTFSLLDNATSTTAFPIKDDVHAGNTTMSTLIENVTTLIANDVGNLSTVTATNSDFNGTTAHVISSNSTSVTIAGFSISDTIFLVLIGFLGLLAAITAGLLLHLCFFHIYISFLGLTTYEYIRNHRHMHEVKAKSMLSTLPNNGQPQSYATNPSKKTNNRGQIYFCSSLRHPNSIDPIDRRYFEDQKGTTRASEDQNSQLHCCANASDYHETGLKTYYMCSLLEESPSSPALGITRISGGAMDREDPINELDNFKTFHCCSTFAATATQRKLSAATTKATLVSDLEAALSARRSYMQYTEQCTFCTFRVRSPMMAKRSSTVSTLSADHHFALAPPSDPASKPASATSKLATAEYQRCCMKGISKHHRWRRKWNCCSSVPDSPDVPNDIITALAMRHQHGSASSAGKKTNATEIPVHFIKTVSGNGNGATGLTSRPESPRNVTLKAQTRSRNSRTWPVVRLRHMMRMLNRYRRPRCRRNATATAAEQVKQNQIRPMQLQGTANGCRHHYHHHSYYDSSSPQPPSSTTTASERSSDQSQHSDSSALTTPSSASQPGTIETILPTSVIRADTSVTYTTPIGINLPPALPPPTRRKLPNPTDLEELAETLGFVSHPSTGALTLSPAQRLPSLNNVYRRQRRKHFLRTRSPTLSPIHESGLSNPTSPQPCRHNAAGCSPNAAAAAVVNTLCASNELLAKASSNSSIHSVSSNSSSN